MIYTPIPIPPVLEQVTAQASIFGLKQPNRYHKGDDSTYHFAYKSAPMVNRIKGGGKY